MSSLIVRHTTEIKLQYSMNYIITNCPCAAATLNVFTHTVERYVLSFFSLYTRWFSLWSKCRSTGKILCLHDDCLEKDAHSIMFNCCTTQYS